MTETNPPSPPTREVLIPLDDRQALLALKEFDRRARRNANDQHGRDGEAPVPHGGA
jgi:hypothetical protein